MHKSLASLFIFTLLFGGGYFWYATSAVCPVPVAYRIGVLNSEFGLTNDEALAAIADAEAVWENETGLDLFSYQSDARFAINFVFDERQQFTNAEETLSANLQEARERNEAVEAEYETLVGEYESARTNFETKRNQYEADLRDYNNEVNRWNRDGGAPQEVFDELNAQKVALDAQQRELSEVRETMNNLISVINALGDRANSLVDRYNEGVETYNETFTESTEFTQGDYRGDHINIYQFTDREQLVLVLAHELGHALGIDHVENARSVMYLRMGEQSIAAGLSEEDQVGFATACGDGSVLSKVFRTKFW